MLFDNDIFYNNDLNIMVQ